MSVLKDQEEIAKAHVSIWDVSACWMIEMQNLKKDLRITIAAILKRNNPGMDVRYHDALTSESITAQKTCFYNDYCKRSCEPAKRELIEQAAQGVLRSASPRRAEVSGWRTAFWSFVFLAGLIFFLLILFQGQPFSILLVALFLISGSWLAGHGLSKYFIKRHLEHISNNHLFTIGDDNEPRRESQISTLEIALTLVPGMVSFLSCVLYMLRISMYPVMAGAMTFCVGMLILLAEALHSYKKTIRTSYLNEMFKAQTMYAIEKHFQFNPCVEPDAAAILDDPFVLAYRAEVERQYRGSANTGFPEIDDFLVRHRAK